MSQSKKEILVVLPLKSRHRDRLEAAASAAHIGYSSPAAVTPPHLQQATVLIGHLPAAKLAQATRLEWLQLNSAGTEAYTQPGVLASHTILTNATGAYGQAVAEHLFAIQFMLQKKLHLYRDNQNQCCWKDEGMVVTPGMSRVLIVGLGDIGRQYARLVKLFGGYTIGMVRRIPDPQPYIDEYCLMDRLEEKLAEADVVVSFLPGGSETYQMFHRERFLRMQPTAIFLNGGRGTVVDTQALYEVLSEGKIQAAGVDVIDPEPFPEDHPLWKLPNFVLTPHVAGYLHMEEILDAIVELASENLIAFLQGAPMKNLIAHP